MITFTREEAQQVEQYMKAGALVPVDMKTTQLLVNALRAKLSEPKPEPVAVVDANDEGYWADILPDRNVKVGQLLYTAPPQREWVGLTHEEIAEESGAAKVQNHMVLTLAEGFFCGARWAEAKLKEKNGG